MDAIWDDGEWISWDEINRHIYGDEDTNEPKFYIEKLIHVSALYQRLHGRTLLPYSFLKKYLERLIHDEAYDWDELTEEDVSKIKNKIELYRQSKLEPTTIEVAVHYESLLHLAQEYEEMQCYDDLHKRHLPIYGELGESYAAHRFGIKLHPPYAQGSDGAMERMLVEVKTITPIKLGKYVTIKRAGNWGVLAIVKIDAQYRIDAKLIQRSRLPKGPGKYVRVFWDEYKSDHFDISPEYYLSGVSM